MAKLIITLDKKITIKESNVADVLGLQCQMKCKTNNENLEFYLCMLQHPSHFESAKINSHFKIIDAKEQDVLIVSHFEQNWALENDKEKRLGLCLTNSLENSTYPFNVSCWIFLKDYKLLPSLYYICFNVCYVCDDLWLCVWEWVCVCVFFFIFFFAICFGFHANPNII